ncbi:GrpB family protein [Pseudoroseomonas globiformis]|uniref:GrpB family protein n=1 Tax=Teichococcus globiformis TaxID=2307229 RepID=A0ABV7FXH0_9PROT
MDDVRQQFGTVQILPSDPRWPLLFEQECALLQAISPNPFAALEHFGSTAVSGLPAKPVIDILVAITTPEALAHAEPALMSLSYRALDVGFQRRRFFRKEAATGGVAYHLHAIGVERWADKGERLFRDWLLRDPKTAVDYARLKKDLARRHSNNLSAYTRAKTDFIRRVVNLARAERGLLPETGWNE